MNRKSFSKEKYLQYIMKYTNCKIPISQTVFSAMDQVLGNEHTSKPPILLELLSGDEPIVEGSAIAEPLTPEPSSGLSPSPFPEETPDSINSFNSGKKVKQKKNDKSNVIVELMVEGLEIKKEEREETKAMLARSEEREQKLVDIMELLVTHYVKKGDSRES